MVEAYYCMNVWHFINTKVPGLCITEERKAMLIVRMGYSRPSKKSMINRAIHDKDSRPYSSQQHLTAMGFSGLKSDAVTRYR